MGRVRLARSVLPATFLALIALLAPVLASPALADAQAPVELLSLSADSGSSYGGEEVTLYGVSLDQVTQVSFGSTPAPSFSVFDADTLVVRTPAHVPGVVDVSVFGGASSASLALSFTFAAPQPELASVFPAVASASGGTELTLAGSFLLGVSQVSFGPVPAASFTVVDEHTLSVVSPPGTVGDIADITVVSPGGAASLEAAFTFSGLGPEISWLTPTSGSQLGGQSLILAGNRLADVSSVLFGTSPASFTVVDASHLSVITPAHVPGPVTVTLISPAGAGSQLRSYTFLPRPTLTSLSPATSDLAGGVQVLVSGSHLAGVSQLRFGSALASFTVVDDSSLSALVPASSAAGVVDISVVSATGPAVLPSAFEYTAVPAAPASPLPSTPSPTPPSAPASAPAPALAVGPAPVSELSIPAQAGLCPPSWSGPSWQAWLGAQTCSLPLLASPGSPAQDSAEALSLAARWFAAHAPAAAPLSSSSVVNELFLAPVSATSSVRRTAYALRASSLVRVAGQLPPARAAWALVLTSRDLAALAPVQASAQASGRAHAALAQRVRIALEQAHRLSGSSSVLVVPARKWRSGVHVVAAWRR